MCKGHSLGMEDIKQGGEMSYGGGGLKFAEKSHLILERPQRVYVQSILTNFFQYQTINNGRRSEI